MLFNSLQFLLFFTATFIVYYLFPINKRWIWLLISSWLFYAFAGLKLFVVLLFSCFLTYITGILLGKEKSNKRKKIYVFCFVLFNILLLSFFKYYGFASNIGNRIFSTIGIKFNIPILEIIAPLGISFYTFKSIGYIIDCYRKTKTPERNFFVLSLFVSFFPTLLAGPIDRSTGLLPQINESKKFNYNNYIKGLSTIFAGYFIKLVMADRFAIVVNNYFKNPSKYFGYATIMAIVFFSFQIYCDFLSYSIIAKGCAKMFGYDVMQNFNMPYLSKSIKEFWQRWHISLSSWFKDYLYIPLGGNRKGVFRTYLNIMITFLISGLWHGANLTFVLWGALHGFYQIVSNITKQQRLKLRRFFHINEHSKLYQIWCVFCTFTLVSFAWILFRAESVSQVMIIVKNIFKLDFKHLTDTNQFYLGLDFENLVLSLLLIVFIILINLINTKVNIIETISKQSYPIRFLICFISLIIILVFGIYGPVYDNSQFIYTQF